MLKEIFILLIVIPLNLFGQTKFTSTKYNYSFIIPNGWHQKNQITNPDVDAKIVDGKGNSFIVSVKTFPTATSLTAKQQLEGLSDQEMEEQFNALYGNSQIVKRGVTNIGLQEFYYIHLLTPYSNGVKLYHKMFLYSEGYKMLTIDAASFESALDETTSYFAVMLSSFEFIFQNNKPSSRLKFREL